MATIIAIVYPDAATAEAAAETARGLNQAGFLKILDSALVTKDADGKIDHKGERHSVRTGAVTGAVLGVITGAIFLVPVVGLAAGAALGGYLGTFGKSGGSDDFKEFREKVDAALQPGGAALIVFGETDARERVVQEMGKHGGTVHSTDFSDEEVKKIQREIDKVAGQ